MTSCSVMPRMTCTGCIFDARAHLVFQRGGRFEATKLGGLTTIITEIRSLATFSPRCRNSVACFENSPDPRASIRISSACISSARGALSAC